MFLNKIRNIFCVPNTKFVSATNVARASKRGNISVGNNVSATMCPRLPGPLRYRTNFVLPKLAPFVASYHSNSKTRIRVYNLQKDAAFIGKSISFLDSFSACFGFFVFLPQAVGV